MISLDPSAVAALLREFGQRSALRGGNPFRAKAYARAADNLLMLTGTHPALEKMRKEIPCGRS
jgi:DNA polymerase (family X)